MFDRFEWLSPSNWKNFERVMGEKGGCGGCWCTVFRQGTSDFKENKFDNNKGLMRSLVFSGKKTGILGFIDDVPVGWVALSPRSDYMKIESSRAFKRIDDKPVWSVTCFFIDKNYRQQGLSFGMLKGLIDLARQEGISILEAYPAIPYSDKTPAAFLWVGILSVFLKNGFSVIKQNGKSRAMVRFEF